MTLEVGRVASSLKRRLGGPIGAAEDNTGGGRSIVPQEWARAPEDTDGQGQVGARADRPVENLAAPEGSCQENHVRRSGPHEQQLVEWSWGEDAGEVFYSID